MRIALVLSLALAIPAVAAGDVGGAERPDPVHVAAASRPPLAVGDVQGRLAALGFLDPTGVDGHEGPRTASAVTAFQKWVGERPDGSAGPRTQAALARATRPSPVDRRGPGRRIEVLLDRQLVLAIEDDRVVRALPTSTGAPDSPTPTGEFHVEAKHETWWSKPFRQWLPLAMPFSGGAAIHEAADVPPHAASHGCVRLAPWDAAWLYGFASVGDRVTVLGRS
jgi:lipoprotein-anchoring transpeptidase ErfK/SrfK